MMMTARNSTHRRKSPRASAQPKTARSAGAQGKHKISPTERWLLISRNVYARAQQRGFVGGDPIEDLNEAIREIDAKYVTDLKGLLSLTDPAEMVDQFQNLFAGYGLGKRSLDRLLEMNRDALEKLAASNRRLMNGAVERTVEGSSLLRKAADEATQMLESMTGTARRLERHDHLPGKPSRAFAHLLSRLATLANSAGEFAEDNGAAEERSARAEFEGIEVHGAVVKAYDGLTPTELAEAPLEALKGISPDSSDKLRATFGMESLRDMANNRFLEQASGIVTLADEEVLEGKRGKSVDKSGSFTALAEAPVSRLKGITPRQARVLRDSLRISSVRDLAHNRFFRVARAIIALADLEA